MYAADITQIHDWHWPDIRDTLAAATSQCMHWV